MNHFLIKSHLPTNRYGESRLHKFFANWKTRTVSLATGIPSRRAGLKRHRRAACTAFFASSVSVASLSLRGCASFTRPSRSIWTATRIETSRGIAKLAGRGSTGFTRLIGIAANVRGGSKAEKAEGRLGIKVAVLHSDFSSSGGSSIRGTGVGRLPTGGGVNDTPPDRTCVPSPGRFFRCNDDFAVREVSSFLGFAGEGLAIGGSKVAGAGSIDCSENDAAASVCGRFRCTDCIEPTKTFWPRYTLKKHVRSVGAGVYTEKCPARNCDWFSSILFTSAPLTISRAPRSESRTAGLAGFHLTSTISPCNSADRSS